MRRTAVILSLALLAASCGDDSGSPPESTSTTVPGPPTTLPAAEPELSAAREAAIGAWASRPPAQVVAEGFDLERCEGEAAPDEPEVDADSIRQLGWAFLSLPLQVAEIDGADGEPRAAVVLSGDEIHPHPTDGYLPTHAWIAAADAPMLASLSGAGGADLDGASIVLGIEATDQGRVGGSTERPAAARFAWLVTDDTTIPFSGECGWIGAFVEVAGDPLDQLPELRGDPRRRAEVAGVTGDEVDFADCANPEIGLGKRVGFGGTDVGLAFGPWPADAGSFTDIELEGWTVLPPDGAEPPTFAEREGLGFPDGIGLDPDGWLFTFTVEEERAVVDTLFNVDEVLGLRIWSAFPDFDDETCFQARQVIAFREFLDSTVPDRPAWDLTPALPGDESVVVETLQRLITDADTRARFRDWTPCTYKLCEANGEVIR